MRRMTLRLLSSTAFIAGFAAPAFAQETFPSPSPDADVVIIDQVQLGDVFANMDVVVSGTATGASAAATATGNITTANSLDNDLDFDAAQQQNGEVRAASSISGDNVFGSPARTITTAYGNSASSSTTNGTDFSTVTQTSNSDVDASSAITLLEVGDVEMTTTASANVNQYQTENGTNRGYQVQTGNANVTATNEAQIGFVANSGAIGATATGNSVASYGSTTTSYNGAQQIMADGTRVASVSNAEISDGTNVAVSATSAGNNMKVENEFGYATLGRDVSNLYQENSADIDADSSLTLTEWAGVSGSTSYGVGNSALISNVGSDTGMYAIQQNNGDVATLATFEGGSNGGVGYASSTSIGNAATASLCHSCGSNPILSGKTAQLNNANITSSAYASTGHDGYISGSATAIGNSATYQSFSTD